MRRGRTNGFTLIEILVTLLITAIFSTAVYAIFLRSLVDAKWIHRATEANRLGQAILRLIEQDLIAAVPADEAVPHFAGSLAAGDTAGLSLLCATNSRALHEGGASDLVGVAYEAAPAETPGLYQLYRKETYNGGRTLQGTEELRLLDDRVLSFRLSYYDGVGWDDLWTEPQLPRAVRVSLELERTIQTAVHGTAKARTFAFDALVVIPAGDVRS